MAKAMVGTRRAYDTCAGCGHARIRHSRHGYGDCSVPVRSGHARPDGNRLLIGGRCPCTGFTQQEGGH